jgi:hypothetical protein
MFYPSLGIFGKSKLVTIGPGEETKVYFKNEEQLDENKEKSGIGFISVSVFPWAYVYIDGKEVGVGTPAAKKYEVKAGEHTVLLRTGDGKEKPYRVRVNEGEEVLIKENFRK